MKINKYEASRLRLAGHIEDLIEYVKRLSIRVSRKGEHVMHVVYLCMVGYQADHAYKYAAIAVVLFVAVNTFAGEE